MRHHFSACMARFKHIRRWNMRRNPFEEDVAQHSLQVAMIAYALAAPTPTGQRRLPPSTRHRRSSPATSPRPSSEIRASFGHIEELSAQKLQCLIPEDLQPALHPMLITPEQDLEWPRVKAADTIAAYIHCIEEIKARNSKYVKSYTPAKTCVHGRMSALL